jgi:hypothetical protein
MAQAPVRLTHTLSQIISVVPAKAGTRSHSAQLVWTPSPSLPHAGAATYGSRREAGTAAQLVAAAWPRLPFARTTACTGQRPMDPAGTARGGQRQVDRMAHAAVRVMNALSQIISVVPAKAGTHNHRPLRSQRAIAPDHSNKSLRWLWIPDQRVLRTLVRDDTSFVAPLVCRPTPPARSRHARASR